MYKIGITGSIGTGKTTIANIFALFNIPIFDADREIKQILEKKDIKKKLTNIWPLIIKKEHIGILYLNSPKTKNALKKKDMRLIRDILDKEAKSDIYALIISGKGDVFCSGADFSEITSIIGKNKNHLSCTLEDIYGYRINAMIFNFENSILRVIEEKREFDVIGKVSLNVWENKKIPQFFIEDLRII